MRLSQSPNGQADSEDVAQEVVCRAYIGIGRFRGEAHLQMWLQTIAQHVIIDKMRAAFRERRLSEDKAALQRMRDGLHAHAAPNPAALVLG
jgi:DNA-directed RNA polymerase specialized sigma24 family protein